MAMNFFHSFFKNRSENKTSVFETILLVFIYRHTFATFNTQSVFSKINKYEYRIARAILRYVIHSRLIILDIKVCMKIFPQGGSKLIVIVSWNQNIYQEHRSHNDPKDGRNPASMHREYSHYEILFDGMAVPTTEIQPGVLRCLIPGM